MSVYAVVSDGILSVRGKTLLFKDKEGNSKTLPVKSVDGIIISGNVHITSGVLSLPDIPVIVYIRRGKPVSVISSMRGKGDLHIKQARAFVENRLDVARAIEEWGALHTTEALTSIPVNRLGRGALSAYRNATSVEELRGYEGIFYKEFYAVLDTFLPGYLQIGLREYYPPPNPGNAAISYINSLIYSYFTVWALLRGLDTTISFIHEPRHGPISLSLDLAEIVRPFLLPKVLFSAIKKYRLVKEDFTKEGVACYLTKTGRRKITQAFTETTQKYLVVKGKRVRFETFAKAVVNRIAKAFEEEYIPQSLVAERWV